jgi:urate oxidase / 2-oxo-4-hydroxy-4-carboxy-5-ureidoimidazoline decarboxylase
MDDAARFDYEISYGKARVPLYRVYGWPLTGLTAIPESNFTGRDNVLVGAEIDVEVFTREVLPAYTVGDNRRVVATDTMKNVILKEALAYDGATLEGFLAHLGHRFLALYPEMGHIRVGGRELPFIAPPVPGADGGFAPSDVLFSRAFGDHGLAMLEYALEDGTARLLGHECGRVGLQLLKVTGSAFTRFARDEHTTLPERGDRPLFIGLDVRWRYADPEVMLDPSHQGYVATEQVRDFAATLFHQFVSESIQHLVHEIGTRLLHRFPQLAEVSFAAQNQTPDPIALSDHAPRQKVYSSPFPAYGLIRLRLTRRG